jgi:integrase
MAAAAVSALAAAMPARYELAVWLGAGAGLREGEALGLTVPRVEFLARRLVIVEQMQNKVLSLLKTRASTRVVPLTTSCSTRSPRTCSGGRPGPASC